MIAISASNIAFPSFCPNPVRPNLLEAEKVSFPPVSRVTASGLNQAVVRKGEIEFKETNKMSCIPHFCEASDQKKKKKIFFSISSQGSEMISNFCSVAAERYLHGKKGCLRCLVSRFFLCSLVAVIFLALTIITSRVLSDSLFPPHDKHLYHDSLSKLEPVNCFSCPISKNEKSNRKYLLFSHSKATLDGVA